eukprot:TRINITY_DN4779_c0_g1_i1.p1 TRINITY_DN4779_c0_g1~~TRINITY_DN4779_c0_g1_i1.p1  ORF type:complete len:271 (+),score=34.87 TRINITY_DN4779_c0_g1_i1:101-814(+)
MYPSYVHNNYIGRYGEQVEPVLEPKHLAFQGNYQIQKSRLPESRNHSGYTESAYQQSSVSPSSTELCEEGHRPRQSIEGSTRISAGSLAMNLKLLDIAISKISSRLRVPEELVDVKQNLLSHFYKAQRSHQEPDEPTFYGRQEPGARSTQNFNAKRLSPAPEQCLDNPENHTIRRQQSWETVVSDDYVTETHFSIKLSPRELEVQPFEEDPMEFLKQRSKILGQNGRSSETAKAHRG